MTLYPFNVILNNLLQTKVASYHTTTQTFKNYKSFLQDLTWMGLTKQLSIVECINDKFLKSNNFIKKCCFWLRNIVFDHVSWIAFIYGVELFENFQSFLPRKHWLIFAKNNPNNHPQKLFALQKQANGLPIKLFDPRQCITLKVIYLAQKIFKPPYCRKKISIVCSKIKFLNRFKTLWVGFLDVIIKFFILIVGFAWTK